MQHARYRAAARRSPSCTRRSSVRVRLVLAMFSLLQGGGREEVWLRAQVQGKRAQFAICLGLRSSKEANRLPLADKLSARLPHQPTSHPLLPSTHLTLRDRSAMRRERWYSACSSLYRSDRLVEGAGRRRQGAGEQPAWGPGAAGRQRCCEQSSGQVPSTAMHLPASSTPAGVQAAQPQAAPVAGSVLLLAPFTWPPSSPPACGSQSAPAPRAAGWTPRASADHCE